MRAVTLEETFYFAFSSRAFSDGIPEALGGTPDLSCIELDGTNAVIDTGASVAAHGSLTAVNIGTIVATAANGFEAGKTYAVVIDTGTVDSVSAVGEVVYEFRIKSASEAAVDLLRDYGFPAGALTTQTGVSDNTAVNLTGIVDAQAQDDLYNGWWGILRAATDGQFYAVRITDFTNTNLLASIEALDAGITLPTPDSGDNFWLMGLDPQYGGGVNLDSIAAVGAVTGAVGSVTGAVGSVTGAVGSVTGAVGSVTGNVGGNVVGSVGSVTSLDAAALQQIVDDLEDGGRLDLLIDLIKAKTDQLTFSAAGFVDSNVMEVNDNGGLTGDGGTTPIDQA